MKKYIFLILFSIQQCFGQIPILSSYPAAKATVYLDFSGGKVEGTLWNADGPIDAKPVALSQADISVIHKEIAEKFVLFNLNITTDPQVYEKAPVNQRIRVLFTVNSKWYGNAEGSSCTGSFTWGNETPAWVFADQVGNNIHYIAAAAMHQIGHTLGLQHQSIYDGYCRKVTEFNGGENNINAEAPIMGVPYYKQSGWIYGTNSISCQTMQNDTALIAGPLNHFGYRKDLAPEATNPLKDVSVLSPAHDAIRVQSASSYHYRLFDVSGRLLDQGNIQAGANSIATTNTANGVLVLEWFNESSRGSEKIIKQ